MNALFFWFLLLAVFYFAYALGAQRTALRQAATQAQAPPAIPSEKLTAMESRLASAMDVTGHKAWGDILQFEGRPKGPSEDVFHKIKEEFAGEPVTPMLLEGENGEVRVTLIPGQKPTVVEEPKWWLHWLLFFVTIGTTTWAGALHAGVNLLQQPERFAVGLPYSLGLLLILGTHELGHYFTAKRHGISVTPPFFIPVPFALGTFGAFIRIKSLTPNRRALFDVAVAGPLAGLVIAIPALWLGLRHSEVITSHAPTEFGQSGVNIASSVLLACLAKLSLGASVLDGNRLLLHPLAFAGWLGLIVTALNLLPIGQLDGGHISHALFGSRRAHSVSVAALFALFLLALFVWPGLMMWAIIVYFIAGTRDAPASDDVSSIGFGRKALGAFAFLLLLLIIVPVPHALYEAIGIHCPYL